MSPSRASRRFERRDLAAVPLFSGLDATGRAQLLEVAHARSFRGGEAVQLAGQPMGRLVVVLAGGLRIVHPDREGHARIVRLLGPGDHVGETEFVLGHHPVHSAFALPGTEVCELGHEDLEALVRAHPAVVREMLVATQRRMLAAELLLSSQSSDDVLTRLATYLLALPGSAAGPGRRDGPGGGRRLVRLPSSQVDVASLLGTTPETLSRRLRELSDADLLERTAPGEFTLDTEGLTALVREG